MAVTMLVEMKQQLFICFEIFLWPILPSQPLTAIERGQFMRQGYLRTRVCYPHCSRKYIATEISIIVCSGQL
jgi:hypothetical protein